MNGTRWMEKEHWNQSFLIVSIVIGVATVMGGAQWAISQLREKDMSEYSELRGTVLAHVRDLELLREKVGQFDAFEAEMRAENMQFMQQLTRLQDTLDAQKPVVSHSPSHTR